MKNTGKSRREGTVNIMSLFHHFGANHPLKFPKVGGEVVNRDFFSSEDNIFHDRKENKQQLVRRLFESVRLEEKHDNKCLCLYLIPQPEKRGGKGFLVWTLN